MDDLCIALIKKIDELKDIILKMKYAREHEVIPVAKPVDIALFRSGQLLLNVKELIYSESICFKKPKKMYVWNDEPDYVTIQDVSGIIPYQDHPVIADGTLWKHCADVDGVKEIDYETNWDKYAKFMGSKMNIDEAIKEWNLFHDGAGKGMSCAFCPAWKFCRPGFGCRNIFAEWAKGKAEN